MLKLRNLFFIIIIPLFFNACSSINSNKRTPLSKQESKQLVQYARSVVCKLPAKKLSRNERTEILTTAPEKIVVTDGYKTGKITLIWKFQNGKEIRYIAEGKLNDFPTSFKSINVSDIQISSGYKGRR